MKDILEGTDKPFQPPMYQSEKTFCQKMWERIGMVAYWIWWTIVILFLLKMVLHK